MTAAARQAQRQLDGLHTELAEAEAAVESEKKAGVQADEEVSRGEAHLLLTVFLVEVALLAAARGVEQQRNERRSSCNAVSHALVLMWM